MKRALDSKKLVLWADRLKRFHESELSMTRFCANEAVSMSSFAYWSKRLTDLPHKEQLKAPTHRTTGSVKPGQISQGQMVPDGLVTQRLFSVRIHESILVSVPADCLETIRCVMRCVHELQKSAQEGRFHQVVVGDR